MTAHTEVNTPKVAGTFRHTETVEQSLTCARVRPRAVVLPRCWARHEREKRKRSHAQKTAFLLEIVAYLEVGILFRGDFLLEEVVAPRENTAFGLVLGLFRFNGLGGAIFSIT